MGTRRLMSMSNLILTSYNNCLRNEAAYFKLDIAREFVHLNNRHSLKATTKKYNSEKTIAKQSFWCIWKNRVSETADNNVEIRIKPEAYMVSSYLHNKIH